MGEGRSALGSDRQRLAGDRQRRFAERAHEKSDVPPITEDS